MSEKTISVGFTKEEYLEILKLAKIECVSISQYIKSKVIPNEFNEKYNDLKQKVLKLKPNTTFTVKSLWQFDEWEKIPKGIKLSLGKHFYKNVEEGNIYNIIITGHDTYGIMCYKKTNS
jgi:hypothetical protein